MIKRIIVICGASASGKDTVARLLAHFLITQGYDAGLVVSDTTRPQRSGEKDGIDYNFRTKEQFLSQLDQYIEHDCFRGWYYGTNYDALSYEYNVVVLTLEGYKKLREQFGKIVDLIILEAPTLVRLQRSIQREGRFRFEHLRRAIVDRKVFNDKQYWKYQISGCRIRQTYTDVHIYCYYHGQCGIVETVSLLSLLTNKLILGKIIGQNIITSYI